MITITLQDNRSGKYQTTVKEFNLALKRVAVHQSLNGWGEPMPWSYTITHLVSGFSVVRGCNYETICQFARELDGLPELGYHSNVARRSGRLRAMVDEFLERERMRWEAEMAELEAEELEVF